MAEVAALLNNSIHLATDKVDLGLDLVFMRKFVEKVVGILADVESMQAGDSAVRVWFRRVAEVASDADVVLDGLESEYLRRVGKFRKKLLAHARAGDAQFRRRVASQIREINARFNSVFQEGMMIDATAVSIQTSSFIDDAYVVGREGYKTQILDMIFNSNDEGEVVSVLPIVGMGGIGKTTVAKLVYNSEQIAYHFYLRIWVSVSDRIESEIDIFKLILESLTGTKDEFSTRYGIVDQVRERIYRRKYFLVLDDVWCENIELWDSFFSELRGMSMGTKNWCLVTTRSAMVARVVSTFPPCSLPLLSEDECWGIVLYKTVNGGIVPEELLALKSQIATSCGGLPLAASVVAGLLRSLSKEYWPEIVNRVSKDEGGNGILRNLRLSYQFLPYPIKKCFAYCSVFDADDVIEKDLLIEYWMAQGFLEQGAQMEETGVTYFDTLVRMSLLEEVRGGRFYRMHPLVHDLALSVSNFQSVSSKKDLSHLTFTVRYLAFGTSGETMMYTDASAYIFRGSSNYEEKLLEFKYLYVLNLSKVDMAGLPDSIGTLSLLRFLNMSNSKITTLPEALCKLYHLQTLRMVDCFHLLGFPKKMSHLTSLRHLHYFSDDQKFQMPMHIGQLTCLRTLEFFNVGDTEGCGIKELEDLNDLKGKLVIRNLELVKSAEARKASLSSKQYLLKLDLQWGSVDREDHTQTLEGLEPHRNLRKLMIRNFMGRSFPQWLGKLEKLVKLKLVESERCTELPALGHLPFLEYVELRGLGEVRCIGRTFYGLDDSIHGSEDLFPALKTLTIINLSNLTEWSEGEVSENGKMFPKLEYLTIRDCFKLATAPTIFPNLKYLELSRCHSMTQMLVSETSLEVVRLLDCENLEELPGEYCLRKVWWLEIRECPRIKEVILGSGQEPLEVIISDCKRLSHVELEHCTSLRSLMVYDCRNLISLYIDFQRTPHLSTLWLHRCPLIFVDEFHLPASLSELRIGPFPDNCSIHFSDSEDSSTLRVLRLYGFPHMESPLPTGIQYQTRLTELWLHDYGSVAVLPEWIGDLTSLEMLGLSNCSNLRQLPSLHAMKGLTKLRILDVYECPLLKERCSPESNPDDSEWSKISHIPNLWIV